MASELRTLDSLPAEILDSALSRLPTPSLLRLAAVNRRFYSVVVRLLNRRLARATTLPQHQVILECFHPSARQSTPYLLCKYLGTDGLDHGPVAAREGGAEHTLDLGDCLDLQDMKRLYSRFRPVPQEASLWPGVHFQGLSAAAEPPPQQQQGSSTLGTAGTAEGAPADELDLVAHDLHLDEGELFSQLCSFTNLGHMGPKPGQYWSCVNISRGVIRVWRHWLAARAEAAFGRADDGGDDEEENILWADSHRRVGYRFRVAETTDGRYHPLFAEPANEEPPVSFRLEYQELLIQTTQLLLMMEESEAQELPSSGKDLVFV